MDVPTEVTEAIETALDTAFVAGTTNGKQVQAAADQATITAATARATDAEAARAALQVTYDDYVAHHHRLDDPTTPPPPPPPPTKPVIGMNFPPTAQVNEDRAGIGRVYVADNQTDMHREPEYVRGLGIGIKRWVFSWKTITTTGMAQCLDSTDRDGIVAYGTKNHEPENDMTAAAWQAIQAAYMPVVRAHGSIPLPILMQYTLDSASGRVAKDWILPKGLVDIQGIDFYPTTLKAQAAGVARIKAFVKQAGLSRYLIGEYGVAKNNPTLGVSLIKDFKATTTDAEALIYWSAVVDKAGAVDYHFTTQTADAWFAA